MDSHADCNGSSAVIFLDTVVMIYLLAVFLLLILLYD